MSGKSYHKIITKTCTKKLNPSLEDNKLLTIVNKAIDSHTIIRECCCDYEWSISDGFDEELTKALKKRGNLGKNLLEWGTKTLESGTCILTLNNINNRIDFWLNASDYLQNTLNKYWKLYKNNDLTRIFTDAETNLFGFTDLMEEIGNTYSQNMNKIKHDKYLLLTNKIDLDLANCLIKREGDLLLTASEFSCLKIG